MRRCDVAARLAVNTSETRSDSPSALDWTWNESVRKPRPVAGIKGAFR
jgi:hypothetical protein